MIRTLLIISCATAVFVSGCATFQKSDMAKLQGSWEGQIVQGNPQHSCSFVISGKNFEFHDETDANVWYKGTFSLREDTSPRQYIAVISGCPSPEYVGKTSMAIYRVEGDTLTIAGNEPGNSAAPLTFDAAGAACMTLKRK